MRLILLSGGSGKRLWPLSNNARSKQFLPLLKSPQGDAESMVQRVVRQIHESGLTDSVTLATNAAQRDVIINQLGEDVDIVTEPERRDTFPAIALASAYLSMEQGCKDDEVVVVMPCDPYTEQGYFNVVSRMVRKVEDKVADLVLMGIRPTYPSPKYGYVVPMEELRDGYRMVQRFTEKPDVETAEKLLSEGAYWNGGVFAFRLGYMMEIVNRHVKADTFSDVYKRYNEFPKKSFDYEVAEKAESVAVVPYYGPWKDLGTWNVLTEELSSNGIGNVLLGDANENTHVVNELEIPIFCDGLRDVVIAASPDGILVCAKNRAEGIKDYVDKLTTRPMYEERRWGSYRVVDYSTCKDGYKSLTKSLTIKAGKCISYQLHRRRDEVWTIVDGEGVLVLDGVVSRVKRGDVIRIGKRHLHAIKAVTDLEFIEVQSGVELVEEDIERFPWEWDF